VIAPASSAPGGLGSPADAGSAGTTWAQFGFGANRTSNNVTETAIGTGNVAQLRPAWTVPVQMLLGSVSVAGSGLYLTDQAGEIQKRSLTTGQVLWSNVGQRFGRTVYGAAVQGGLVLTGGFEALSARSGALVWRSAIGNQNGPPTVDGSTMFGNTGNNWLVALDMASGRVLWQDHYIQLVGAAVANGEAFICSMGHITAIRTADGSPLWTAKQRDCALSTPVESGGLVYATGYGINRITALDATTGAPRWSFTGSGAEFSPPAVADGTVYAASGHNLYALNANTGALRWSYSTQGGTPAAGNGVVYVGSNDHLYALDAATGTLLWTGTAAGPVQDPVVAGSNVYAYSDDGMLHAWSLDLATKPIA
jgi:outer membrane protein assembly factor BamB